MADINTGNTGAGDDEKNILGRMFERARGAAQGRAFSSGSEDELQSFISTVSSAKTEIKELQDLMGGTGTTNVSTFKTTIKDLNKELKDTVRMLERAGEGMEELPASVGGEGGAGRNGGDVVMPDPARAQMTAARDTGTGVVDASGGMGDRFHPSVQSQAAAAGQQIGEAGWGGIGPGALVGAALASGGGGGGAGRGRLATAGQIGVAALAGVGYHAVQQFEARIDEDRWLDMFARSHGFAAGTGMGAGYDFAGQRFGGGTGTFQSIQEFAGATDALRAQGIMPGTEAGDRAMRGVEAVGLVRPELDFGQIAGQAASLEYGPVGMGLRQRGIVQYGDDYPTAMRKILRAVYGEQPTREHIEITVPGTPGWIQLMALLGNDPEMVAEVLEFGRRDARGVEEGVDVTTTAGAEAIGLGRESAFGARRARDAKVLEEDFFDDDHSRSRIEDDMARSHAREEGGIAETTNRALRPLFDRLGGGLSRLTDAVDQNTLMVGGAIAYMARGPLMKIARGLGTVLVGKGAAAAGGAATTAAGGAAASVGAKGALASLGLGGAAVGSAAAATFGSVSAAASWVEEKWFERLFGEDGWIEDEDARDAAHDLMGHDMLVSTGRRIRSAWQRLRGGDDSDPDPSGSIEPAGGGLAFMPPDLMGEDEDLEPGEGEVLGAGHTGPGISEEGFGGVRPHVARAGHWLRKLFGPFPGGIGGVGERSNPNSDHPRGLALDLMTMDNVKLGNRVVNFITKNWDHLGVKYLIWRQKINSGDGRGWRKMEDRGSPTANHMDHPHISFEEHPSGGTSSIEPFTDVGEGGDSFTTTAGEAESSGATTATGSWGSQEEIDVFNAFFGGGFGPGSLGEEGQPGDAADESSGYDVNVSGERPDLQGGERLSDREIAELAAYGGWRGQDIVTATAVALAESRGNPQGIGDTHLGGGQSSRGLWQIHFKPGRDEGDPVRDPHANMDPFTNARNAYTIYQRQGWGAWSVHPASSGYTPNNSYRDYMDRARKAASKAGTGSTGTTEPQGGLSFTEPAGGTSSGDISAMNFLGGASGGMAAMSSAPRGPSPQQVSSPTKIDVTFKIERATYDEAEKFAEWVTEIMSRKDDLNTVGSR